MKRVGSEGQGALEYLIIIAAVLAIAAIVVLFITGAFKGQSDAAKVAACKGAASRCSVDLATSAAAACSYCVDDCTDIGIVAAASECSTYSDTVAACKAGAADCITQA